MYFATSPGHRLLCTVNSKQNVHCSTEGKDIMCVGWWTVQCSKRQQSTIVQGGCKQFVGVSNKVVVPLQVQSKFILALCFSFLFMIVEVIGGYFANRCVLHAKRIWLYTSVLLNGMFCYVLLQSSNHDRCSSPVVRCRRFCCCNLCCTLC